MSRVERLVVVKVSRAVLASMIESAIIRWRSVAAPDTHIRINARGTHGRHPMGTPGAASGDHNEHTYQHGNKEGHTDEYDGERESVQHGHLFAFAICLLSLCTNQWLEGCSLTSASASSSLNSPTDAVGEIANSAQRRRSISSSTRFFPSTCFTRWNARAS